MIPAAMSLRTDSALNLMSRFAERTGITTTTGPKKRCE